MEQGGETELLVTAKNCRTLIGKRIIVPSDNVKKNVDDDIKKDTKAKNSEKSKKSSADEGSSNINDKVISDIGSQDKSNENCDLHSIHLLFTKQ